MLSESIDDWAAQWKAEGIEEGQARLLVRFLEDKFGPLAPNIRKTVYNLDDDSVFERLKRAMTAQTLSEVIGH